MNVIGFVVQPGQNAGLLNQMSGVRIPSNPYEKIHTGVKVPLFSEGTCLCALAANTVKIEKISIESQVAPDTLVPWGSLMELSKTRSLGRNESFGDFLVERFWTRKVNLVKNLKRSWGSGILQPLHGCDPSSNLGDLIRAHSLVRLKPRAHNGNIV